MLTPELLLAHYPWLSTTLIILGVGASFALFLTPNWVRWVTITSQLVVLLIVCLITLGFDASYEGFQYGERYSWIPSLNIHYQIGIDGLSVLFLPILCLLFLAVTLSTWNAIRTLPSAYFALLLILQISMLGVFIALDTVLFFLFWELSVIPLFILISLWGGGANRRYAAMKYALFMIISGIPLLLGLLLLSHTAQGWVFDYIKLLTIASDHHHQTIIFFLLLLGFAVKIPVFPFHTWLPIVAQEGSAGILALIAGLKVGVYGLIRFALPLAPDAAHDFKWLLLGLGMLGLLYGAITALGQTNLRRMLAFASISHVGLVILGIASFSLMGIQGAIFQLLNFVLIVGGLYLLIDFIHQRTGSAEAAHLGGIAGNMPVLVGLFFLLSLASIGIPGTSGFAAELLLIIAILKSYTGAGLVVLFVVVLGAAYTLNAFRMTLLGPPHAAYLTRLPDLLPRELMAISLVALWTLVLGIYPQGVINTLETSSQVWLRTFYP